MPSKTKWEGRLYTSLFCLFLGVGLMCISVIYEEFTLLLLLGSLFVFITGIFLSWLVNKELDMIFFRPGKDGGEL